MEMTSCNSGSDEMTFKLQGTQNVEQRKKIIISVALGFILLHFSNSIDLHDDVIFNNAIIYPQINQKSAEETYLPLNSL